MYAALDQNHHDGQDEGVGEQGGLVQHLQIHLINKAAVNC